MSIAGRTRFIFLSLSSLGALAASITLIMCLFSSNFRYVENEESRGVKHYGLFRFCFEPKEEFGGISYLPDVHKGEYSCHLRKRAPKTGTYDIRDFYADFELGTLILFSVGIICGLISLAFGICTIHLAICGLAHSTMLLTAAISSMAGFVVYTYFNELKDNQSERYNGQIFVYKYGNSYYYAGGATCLYLLSFMISLFASALIFRYRKDKENKRHSLYL